MGLLLNAFNVLERKNRRIMLSLAKNIAVVLKMWSSRSSYYQSHPSIFISENAWTMKDCGAFPGLMRELLEGSLLDKFASPGVKKSSIRGCMLF